MRATASEAVAVSSGGKEEYTLEGRAGSAHMGRRVAETQARFFLSHLRANMSLLDCGCGPGSITCGLAAVVAPGETVGIDANPDEVARAQALAAERELSNVRFETADVYELPFADETFDAVFSHALLEHLQDPLRGLQEMHRVLKSGGIVGVRAADNDGNLHAPPDPEVEHLTDLFERILEHNGGNPYVGRHLPALLRRAGFERIEGSASYDLLYKSNFPRAIKDYPFVETLIDLGWVDREEVDSLSDAYDAWLEHPDLLNARAFCQAVGWKP